MLQAIPPYFSVSVCLSRFRNLSVIFSVVTPDFTVSFCTLVNIVDFVDVDMTKTKNKYRYVNK